MLSSKLKHNDLDGRATSIEFLTTASPADLGGDSDRNKNAGKPTYAIEKQHSVRSNNNGNIHWPNSYAQPREMEENCAVSQDPPRVVVLGEEDKKKKNYVLHKHEKGESQAEHF